MTAAGAVEVVAVTSEADGGPGSFRAAVDAAKADARIGVIEFAAGLHVEVLDDVVCDGQATGSHDTVDAIQPGCTDPHPADTDTEIRLDVRGTTITGVGALDGGFDTILAAGNNDEAVKASEEDDGDIRAQLKRAAISGGDGDAVEIEEEGAGDNTVTVQRVTITGNEGEGLKVQEEDAGSVDAKVQRAAITGNDGNGVEVEQEDDGEAASRVRIDRSDLSGNDHHHRIEGVAKVSIRRTTT